MVQTLFSFSRCLIYLSAILLICPSASFVEQVGKNCISKRELTRITVACRIQRVSFLDKKKVFENGVNKRGNGHSLNTFQRMRDKLKKISLIALLTGLFAIIFSSKRVNADTTPMTQTSIKDGTSAVSSKLFVTGGGAVKKQVILPDSPKASKKKGMKRAMVSGAIAGTALGLGWFKKEESEMENRKKLFHAIVEPPTSSLPQDEVDVTKQINKFMTEAKEADVKANGEAAKEALITSLKIETITKNMSPSPIIRTYSDTNAYLNSLVNTDAFKAEQGMSHLINLESKYIHIYDHIPFSKS